MKLSTILFLLLFTFQLPAQIKLIEPIRESEPMTIHKARSLIGVQSFRNWGIEKLELQNIMNTQKGAGIRICICDTGRPNHNDLNGNISESKNFTSDADDFDEYGHSTHVAGIVHEIAPEARLYFAKVLDHNGSGTSPGVAAGIDWCIFRKANIINLSLGSPSPSAVIKKAIQDAAMFDIVVVAAAGNDGQSETENKMGYPARYNETIAIGSINDLLNTSYFSSSGDEGDVMAPGEKILSTWLNGNYIVLSGTSMATPFVSGVAALYLEKYGTIAGLEKVFETSATDMNPAGFDRYSFWGFVTPQRIFEKDTVETPPQDTIIEEPIPNPGDPLPFPSGWQWVFVGGAVIGIFILVYFSWKKQQ